MPKMKTRKSIAKRFKRTAKGRFKRRHSGHNHLRTRDDSAKRRKLRRTTMVSKDDEQRLRKIIVKKR